METGDLEHGRVMEHWMKVESKAVASPTELINEAGPTEILPDSSSVSSQNDIMIIKKIGQRITEKIDGLPRLLPDSEPCIFRVHDGLRSVNEKAYTPRLVSIGPYHRQNRDLHAMEELKLRYLDSLLQRVNNNNNHNVTVSVEFFLFNVDQTIVDSAQACYADPICLERDKFLEMLVLDACFIIEFLRKCLDENLRDKGDPIFRSSWMHTQICSDLMLLENQLPFFVLSKLFDMIITHAPGVNNVPLTILAVLPMCQMLPKEYCIRRHIEKIFNEKTPAQEIKHFLDLVHRFYLPSSEKRFDSSTDQETCSGIPSVTELQEVGISFKVDENVGITIFDISYKDGQMKIPNFKVADKTEQFFRNIIAYEQHCSGVDIKYFTDYQYLMDLLINTEKDVSALRLYGIIDNMLGYDGEVARMFNKLGDGVLINRSTFYYSDVCQEVKEHCEKPWNRSKAKLTRNYFNNRWRGISTVAASVLLLLTLIQTVVALIDLLA